MSATEQSASTPFQSFADRVNYPAMYADLEQQGIFLTGEEKKKCEAICGDRLRNHDGGQVIGNSFGGTIESIGYMLLAFLKNIFTGNFSGIGDMFSNFGSTVTATGKQGQMHDLQHAEVETYERLKKEGGNLATAAEYITGVKPSHDNSEAKVIPSSIANQVSASIGLSFDTNTSLNATNVATATAPVGLPPRTTTQPLTSQR